jgi:hypothetical protein
MDETDGILDIGTAVVTVAGNLPAKYIIHVVSPIWSGGENGEEEKLGQAVFNALTKADSYKIGTISVPCLSGGSFGFPRDKCATIMVKHCLQYLDQNPNTSIKLIRFVNMDAATVRAFKIELEKFMRNELISPNVVRKSVLADKSFEKKTDVSVERIQENKPTQNDVEVPEPIERQVVETRQVETTHEEAGENSMVDVRVGAREEIQVAN